MPTMAENMYPGGPSNDLGNKPRIPTISVPEGLKDHEVRSFVDDWITGKGLKPGDLFKWPQPGYPNLLYKYLGPQEDNRNWIIHEPGTSDKVS